VKYDDMFLTGIMRISGYPFHLFSTLSCTDTNTNASNNPDQLTGKTHSHSRAGEKFTQSVKRTQEKVRAHPHM